MQKYKISKSKLNEFFGLFGKKKKPEEIQSLIDNDPVLQKINKEIGDLNDKAADWLKKDPATVKILKKYGIDID